MKKFFFLFFFCCTLSRAQSPICLTPATYSTIPLYGIYPIISTDLNNDSYLDLINLFPNGVFVYTSTAGNGFQSTYTYTNTAVNMRDVVSRDFNGDGNVDIATGTDNAQILVFNGMGNGTFAAPTSYTLGGTPGQITSEDFNNDGKYDLAVTDYWNNSLFILKNTGNGIFSNNNYHFLGFNPNGIRCGDFNNDGKKDLAIQHGSTIDLFENNGNLFFTSTATVVNSMAMEITDVNSDGKLDIVSFDSSMTNVIVHKGLGNFSFSSISYSVGSQPTDLAVGDINSDGKMDIITNNFYADFTILLNTGNGNYNNSYQDTVQVGTFMPWGLSVMCDDFNKDGNSDLLFGYDNGEPAHMLYNCTAVTLAEHDFIYDFKVYPIPANEYFEIRLEDVVQLDSELSISITNQFGQVIQEQKTLLNEGRASIYTNNLNTGMYFVTLHLGVKTISKKLLVYH